MSAQKEVGRFFRHSTVYAVGNALNRVGALLLLPVYTRYLSVAQYGQLELLYVIASLATGLLSIGIAHATLRFYFDYKDVGDRNAVVSTNLVATTVISVAGLLPAFILAEPLARGFVHDPGMALGVRLILASVVLELGSQVCLAYLRARERSMLFVGLALGKLALQIAVNATLLIVYDAGVLGVVIGNVAAVALGWLVLLVIVARECGLRFEWAKLMPVLKYSAPFLLSTVVGLVSSNADRVLINELLDLKALGLYALAIKFAKLISDLIGEPFAQAYGAFRYTIMDKDNAADLQARIMRYLTIGCGFAALGLLYFTGPLLRLIATPDYWAAERLMPLLVAAAVVRVLAYPTQTGILWSKNTRHIFHNNVLQAVVSAVATLVLVLAFGLTGACLAALLTAVVSFIAYERVSQRYFKVDYGFPRLGLIGGLAAGFWLAGLLVEPLGTLAELALKAALLFAYLVAAWRWALDGEERQALRAKARSRLAPRAT